MGYGPINGEVLMVITVRGRQAEAGYHLSAEQFIGPQPTKYKHYSYSNTIK